MSLTCPKNTLAYHRARVFTSSRDMSHIMCAHVAGRLKEYVNSHAANVKPESDALWFYGLNHGVALISARRDPFEPLPSDEAEFVRQYHAKCAAKSVRAFYYLLIICIREFRHNKSLSKDLSKIADEFGKPVADFFKSSAHGGEQEIHQAFVQKPPHTAIGKLVGAVRWGFYNSAWHGGYGGKAWGAVTDCLEAFVTGKYTAEMMMDTVWTLAHNNGPIFNKGHLYQNYTHFLTRLLDVQRSGQIPQALQPDPGGDKTIRGFADAELLTRMDYLRAKFPDDIGSHVDWFVVEALGSVHKYADDKEAQVAKHGVSANAVEAEKQAIEKALAFMHAKKAKEKAFAENNFQVSVDLFVPKVKRQAA